MFQKLQGIASQLCVVAIALAIFGCLHSGSRRSRDPRNTLSQIVIPEVNFKETAFTNVIQYLNAAIQRRCSRSRPPHIRLDFTPTQIRKVASPHGGGKAQQILVSQWQDKFENLRELKSRANTPITFNASQLSVFEAFNICCSVAELPYAVVGNDLIVGNVLLGRWPARLQCRVIQIPAKLAEELGNRVYAIFWENSKLNPEDWTLFLPDKGLLVVLCVDDPWHTQHMNRVESNMIEHVEGNITKE